MPSRNAAPCPAPRQCSPSTMHSPSPPRRTGTPLTAAATRSRIGKPRQAGMLTGLIVPSGRWMGPADEMPTPVTLPLASASASVMVSSAAAHTFSASGLCGVGWRVW